MKAIYKKSEAGVNHQPFSYFEELIIDLGKSEIVEALKSKCSAVIFVLQAPNI